MSDTRAQLQALKTSVLHLLSEIEAIERTLPPPSLALPSEEWLSIASVMQLFGFPSERACVSWANRNNIQYHRIGKKIVFAREELSAKLKAAPGKGQRPTVRKPSSPSDEAAERALHDQVVALASRKKKRHGP